MFVKFCFCKVKFGKTIKINMENILMTIDIPNQLVHITCPDCNETYIKTIDELKDAGVISCPKCSHPMYLKVNILI